MLKQWRRTGLSAADISHFCGDAHLPTAIVMGTWHSIRAQWEQRSDSLQQLWLSLSSFPSFSFPCFMSFPFLNLPARLLRAPFLLCSFPTRLALANLSPSKLASIDQPWSCQRPTSRQGRMRGKKETWCPRKLNPRSGVLGRDLRLQREATERETGTVRTGEDDGRKRSFFIRLFRSSGSK